MNIETQEAHSAAEAAPAFTREYPPYPVMIDRLFKQMPDVPFATLLHAAVGIVGEAAEWLASDSFKNIKEEAGDMEFYVCALKSHFIMDPDGAAKLNIADMRAVNPTVGMVFHNVVTLGGDIIDVVKKSWVYNKPLNTAELTRLVILLDINLDAIYRIFALDKSLIQRENQVKLIGPGGRFESGFYSDSAAIARKDKQPGEDRSFFGKATAA